MTLLCDASIVRRVQRGKLGIEPFDRALVQPASVDVLLDREFLRQRRTFRPIDPAQDQTDRWEPESVPDGQAFMLNPGEFALAATHEHITLPADLAARVEGKSSLGRHGLAVHVTAGFIDPGFTGQITLELVNHSTSRMLLWPGMKIGQLCLFRLNDPAAHPYGSRRTGSHYQGQRGPQASRSHERFTSWAHQPDAA
jgi:dCTP deaminase